VVDAAGEIQSTLVGWVDTIGPVPMLIALTVLIVSGIVLTAAAHAPSEPLLRAASK
jgi:hypothetical protein